MDAPGISDCKPFAYMLQLYNFFHPTLSSLDLRIDRVKNVKKLRDLLVLEKLLEIFKFFAGSQYEPTVSS